MKTNTSSPSSPSRNNGLSRWFVAFLLGLASLFLMPFIGMMAGGEVAIFIGVGAFPFLTQYLLSRGHPQAQRKDWPIILCLNWQLLLAACVSPAIDPKAVAMRSAFGLLLVGLISSYAGAWLAARIARCQSSIVKEIRLPGWTQFIEPSLLTLVFALAGLAFVAIGLMWIGLWYNNSEEFLPKFSNGHGTLSDLFECLLLFSGAVAGGLIPWLFRRFNKTTPTTLNRQI